MKKISLLLLFLMLCSLAACGKSNSSKNETIRLVLDWTPNTNHTGLYVAQSKGYFSSAGLEVEIMQPPEGSSTSLVAAGGAEFGISFQDSLAPAFALESPLPVTAVAAIIQHNTSGIVSLKETGIDTPSKMAGHSYATWDGPIELAMIEKMVQDDGGNFDDVQLIPNTVTDVITALKTDIDSVWIYYGWDGIATELAGLETNFLNFVDYGDEFDFYSPVIIANNDFLEKQPEKVKAFLEAVQDGYEYAIANPEEAARILLKEAPELDEAMVIESQSWLSKHYKAEVDQWGYIDATRWDRFYQWLYDNNLIERQISTGYGFTNEYLPQ